MRHEINNVNYFYPVNVQPNINKGLKGKCKKKYIEKNNKDISTVCSADPYFLPHHFIVNKDME